MKFFIILFFCLNGLFAQTINDLESNDLFYLSKFKHWYTSPAAGDSSTYHFKQFQNFLSRNDDLALSHFKTAYSFAQKNDRYNLCNSSIDLYFVDKAIRKNELEKADRLLKTIHFQNERNIYVKKFIDQVAFLNARLTGLKNIEEGQEIVDNRSFTDYFRFERMSIQAGYQLSNYHNIDQVVFKTPFVNTTNGIWKDRNSRYVFTSSTSTPTLSFGLDMRIFSLVLGFNTSFNAFTRTTDEINHRGKITNEGTSFSYELLTKIQMLKKSNLQLFGQIGIGQTNITIDKYYDESSGLVVNVLYEFKTSRDEEKFSTNHYVFGLFALYGLSDHLDLNASVNFISYLDKVTGFITSQNNISVGISYSLFKEEL